MQPRQTQQQRLLLAPNVTLALEILRMPVMELQAFLEQQAQENPLLELDQEAGEDTDAADAGAAQEEGTPDAADTPGPAAEDWGNSWELAGGVTRGEEDPDAEEEREERRLVTSQSLRDALRLQLGCQRLDDRVRALGEALIECLDEHGYLEDALEDLESRLGAPVAQLEAVLAVLQRFDPPGVGARSLRECLLIQLRHQGAQDALAGRIVCEHFELLIQRQTAALARVTGADIQDVEEACEQIRALNPKPGRAFAGEPSPTLVPDLVMVWREGHWDVDLNDQALPRLAINRTYHRMLSNPETPSEAREFLQRKFRHAGWVIRAIDERNTTLLAVGRCLISLQREFIEQGRAGMRPLTQLEVAQLVGRHPSTVSRAIAGKTIDTPHGILRLEQLFASRIPQAEPDAQISDARIKSEITQLIAEEDAARPLSDEVLVRRLAERHITVARRTIAKYRSSLKILPAHLRRRRR